MKCKGGRGIRDNHIYALYLMNGLKTAEHESIDKKAAAAKALGLTYGQYMAARRFGAVFPGVDVMGLARKLRKRADRFARVGKAKAAKRERKVEEKIALTARHREKEVNAIEEETWNHMQVMIYTVLREQRHFGGRRLTRLFQRVRVLSFCVRDDDVTEEQIAAWVKEDAHFDARPGKMDVRDDHSVRLHAVQRIFLLFAYALANEFGFGPRMLASVWHACGGLGRELKEGKRTIDGMVEQLVKIPRFHFDGRES